MSWKSQGSINRISQYSSFTTNNIVTDTFVLKSKYKGLIASERMTAISQEWKKQKGKL